MFLSKISIMWPMLLDMTREDCRRTLRRLELEAYSSMISVFRAQGALADDRKKLLEDLRGVLNISNDRHTAEARRVSNDELLATIAEQLSGPNTGLGWVCEGRRKIPILPRSIPQTVYTELADQAAISAAEENEKIMQKISEQRNKALPMSPKDTELEGEEDMELDETCAMVGETAENEKKHFTEGSSYPPVVMWDQSAKLAVEEGPPRKRSRTDETSPPATSPPAASVPPPPKANHQRYLNISQIYSNYSKTPPGKISNQTGKNFNPGGKMQGKANHGHGPKSVSKHRNLHGKHSNPKHSGQVAIPHHQVRSGIKSPTDPHIAGSQALNIQNPVDVNSFKSQTSGFQANFAQSIAKKISIEESNGDTKQTLVTSQQMESPTMQLLTQPPVQQETIVSMPLPEEVASLPPSNQGTLLNTPTSIGPSPSTPTKIQTVSGKTCQLIIKKKQDTPGGENVTSSPKIHVTSMQIISKPTDMGGIKVLQNRQVVVAPPHSAPQKVINSSGKLITTKFVQQIPPRSQTQINSNIIPKSSAPNPAMEKVIIVSKSMSPTVQSSILQRSLCNTQAKNIIISSTATLLPKESDLSNQTIKNSENDGTIPKTPVNNNSEVKMPAKTFLVNPKSGQKMVVLPAKARGKGSLIGQVPLLQVKGLPGRQTAMKFVPLGSQTMNSQAKSNNVTIVSKTNSNIVTNVISKESLTHINSPTLASSTFKQSHVQIAPKPKGQAIIRPATANTKSNLILLQKTNTISKGTVAFTKNGNDLSKIMMTNKVSPLTTQPSSIVSENDLNCAVDIGKNAGNVIVLQLSNDQLEQGNLTEFLQGDQTAPTLNTNEHLDLKSHTIITEDTPVMFHSQISDQVCNTDSMESTGDMMEVVNMEEAIKSDSSAFDNQQSLEQITADNKETTEDSTTASSIVTDWEMSVEHASDKQKACRELDKLALELEMSSDSDTAGYMDSSQDESKKEPHDSKDISSNQQMPVHEDECNMLQQHSSLSQASRTLLSQLQDEGSSSNDSSFVLTKNLGKKFGIQSENNAQAAKDASQQSESIMRTKDEDSGSLSESHSIQVPKVQSRSSRMDIFSTAIASADINLDSFEYLEDGIITAVEMFQLAGGEQGKVESGETRSTEEIHKEKDHSTLEQRLHQLLEDDNIDEAEERLDPLESSCPSAGAME